MEETKENKLKLKEKDLQRKKLKDTLKKSAYFLVPLIFFVIGFYAHLLYIKYLESENLPVVTQFLSEEEPPLPQKGDEPIKSPLNGVQITESDYEKITEHIPHAVMISNNRSARDEQYGLNYADVVYEAQVEGGITRFMGIFWSNQEDYTIKPVRSVRKYFLDWATEYGNIPVTFSGFATTNNPDTNAWGFYKENDIRITYYDWPLKWDDKCLETHPTMHCKRTTPEWLYKTFKNHNWTFKSWKRFSPDKHWEFEKKVESETSNKTTEKFAYSFSDHIDWQSRWIYNEKDGEYKKKEPDNKHIDNQNKKQISASTIVILRMDREYTYDDEGRVAYKTVGTGDAYVIRDGIRIEAKWKKDCDTCRTFIYKENKEKTPVKLKPGLIWIAAVPTDRKIEWK